MTHANDEATPVFGLTKAQLRPIISSAVPDEPVASFDVSIQHQVHGFCGYSAEKSIPTFSYTTESGQTERITVFVKRFHRTGPAEAHHYAHLQKLQAPVPRMYGVMTDQEQREILFLEYLEPIGDIHASEQFMHDPHNFRQLLAATARFNTVQPSGEYAHQLPCKDVVKGLTDAVTTLDNIWEHACGGDLGDDLKKFCSNSSDKLHQLQEFAAGLVEPIAQMEMGLIHSDIYPENTGWRQETGELLILDLEWIGFGPRFYDAASLLGAPDNLQPHHQRRDELARYYLEEYVRWGGASMPMDKFMEGNSILWIAETLNMLWFRLARALDGRVDWTDDQEEGRRFFRNELRKTLDALLHQTSSA